MKKTRIVNINKWFLIIVVFIFAIIICQLFYIGLGNIKVGNQKLSEFASNRNTKTKQIVARRGTIYSSDDIILAKDVNSYTVIAHLNSKRTIDKKNPMHVVDKEKTAQMLSPLINMTEEKILELLNIEFEYCDEDKNCKMKQPDQVELGPGGRGITELIKDEIDSLSLPGIDFLSSNKRYYPNGNFLSYTLGYARANDEGDITGEMGLELSLNNYLSGINGYKEYQSDRDGYQITNLPNREVKAIDGSDVYLTIDTNIQMFAENAISKLEESHVEWANVSVMNAKTGEILAIASSPNFNNNTLEIKSYYDPFVSNQYEPGSVMKVFSWMASMENGLYEGEKKYLSGSLKVDDNTTIRDWNRRGWGNITFDEGFYVSSNVAASTLGLELGRAKLKDYYISLGFGKETNIGLPNEMKGTIDFKYPSEIASSSYGQGITVTAMQMLKALGAVANNGVMLNPYLIQKIVDSEGNIILEKEKTEIKRVASKETIQKMKTLLRGVVSGASNSSTGTPYYIKGYDIAGKTGTAEIAGGSGYLKGTYVRSFGCFFPAEEPEIVIYIAASKLSNTNYLYSATKTLIKNIATFKNINPLADTNDTFIFELDNYINKDTKKTETLLSSSGLSPIVIGDGEKIIDQYPEEGSILNIDNKVFLLTSSEEYRMINIKSFSRSEAQTFCNLTNIKCIFDGYGYVTDFDLKKGSILNSDTVVNINLNKNY